MVLIVNPFSAIALGVVVIFSFYLGLLRLLSFYLPRISLPQPLSWIMSRYLYTPAFICSRHLKRLPGDLGYVPSRSLTLLIICYIALNVVLCAINYPPLDPDTWYLTSKKRLISWIADRCGVLSFANIAITIMFSGRNSPFLWITGQSRTNHSIPQMGGEASSCARNRPLCTPLG